MKTLDKVIFEAPYSPTPWEADALHYLKEYKEQKYVWKKLYQLFHEMFWGLEEEYPLDGERIANLFFDAYNEGFDDENA